MDAFEQVVSEILWMDGWISAPQAGKLRGTLSTSHYLIKEKSMVTRLETGSWL
jgi:hypothetical protein